MSHRREKSVGRGKILWALTLAALMLPKTYNVNATNPLGTFETGETGIKLCAVINNGNEDSLRFKVINSVGFSSDIVVPNNTCRLIQTVAANYTIRENMPQEYVLDSVSGGTVSADNTAFAATATGQYTVIYENTYSQKRFLHSSGTSTTNQGASQVEISFDANGGTGTMSAQRFAINTATTLTTNSFTRANYAFNGWNTSADGSGTTYTDAQQVTLATGGEITLYAQWLSTMPINATQLIESLANPVAAIDFRSGATTTVGNGNGVNKYTEDNTDIYYFRGQVENNNVVWGDKCWKMLRTTASGGVKMIYNGEATQVGGVYQCNATGIDTQISIGNDNTFAFNAGNGTAFSPAYLGYMYGDAIQGATGSDVSVTKTFSHSVSRSGNTYTLDMTAGNYVTDTWANAFGQIGSDYRYFCTDGTTSCDDTKIAYIYAGLDSTSYYYLPIGGYNDIEDAVAGMFTNTTDSTAKATIEQWFADEGLDTLESDLEDAVFCNDRGIDYGTLGGEDESVAAEYLASFTRFNAFGRNMVAVNNNYAPSLDCANKDDAFTKSDTTKGNAKLAYKVGLITADELTLAGVNYNDSYGTTNFLNNGQATWTMSPNSIADTYTNVIWWDTADDDNGTTETADSELGLRPVVSLGTGITFAAGGAGTTSNPYVVQ